MYCNRSSREIKFSFQFDSDTLLYCQMTRYKATLKNNGNKAYSGFISLRTGHARDRCSTIRT
jgi:hypothetical protein